MLSRTEVEMNLNWAEQHPALFVAAVAEFQQQYAANPGWTISIDLSRDRYVVLTATRSLPEG